MVAVTSQRGYGSPLHQHHADEETFLVLDGELRVEVGGEARPAGPGAVAFLPRKLPHALVVTSPQARFLTLHAPAGFGRFKPVQGLRAPCGTGPVPPDPSSSRFPPRAPAKRPGRTIATAGRQRCPRCSP